MGTDPDSRGDLQAQIDELVRQATVHRADIDSLGSRADTSEARSDDIEARARVDRDMIAELHRDGVLSREHAAQMEVALKSSRTIGAAIGLIMASRQVGEDEAFTILKRASQDSNRKLRDLAADLVDSARPLDRAQ